MNLEKQWWRLWCIILRPTNILLKPRHFGGWSRTCFLHLIVRMFLILLFLRFKYGSHVCCMLTCKYYPHYQFQLTYVISLVTCMDTWIMSLADDDTLMPSCLIYCTRMYYDCHGSSYFFDSPVLFVVVAILINWPITSQHPCPSLRWTFKLFMFAKVMT